MRDTTRDRQPCGIATTVTPFVAFCMTLITLGVTVGHEWLNHASRQTSRLPYGEGGDESQPPLDDDIDWTNTGGTS